MKTLFLTIFISLLFMLIFSNSYIYAFPKELDEELISKITNLATNKYHKYLISKDNVYYGECIYGIEFESSGVNLYDAKFRLTIIEKLKVFSKTFKINSYIVKGIEEVKFPYKYDIFANGIKLDLEAGNWIIIVVNPEMSKNIIWVVTNIIDVDKEEALRQATYITTWISRYIEKLYNEEKKDLNRLKLQDINDLDTLINTKMPKEKVTKYNQIKKQNELKFNYQDVLMANKLVELAQDETKHKKFISQFLILSNENKLFKIILAAIYTLMDIEDIQYIQDKDIKSLIYTVCRGEFKKAKEILEKKEGKDIQKLFKNCHVMDIPTIKNIDKEGEPIWNPNSVMHLRETERLLRFLKLQSPVTIAVIDNNFSYSAIPEDMWLLNEDVNGNGILDKDDLNWEDDDNDGKVDNFIGKDFFRHSLSYYDARLLNRNPLLNNIDLNSIFTGIGHGSFVCNVIYNTPGSEYIKIYPIRIMDYTTKEQKKRGSDYDFYLIQLAQAIDYASKMKGIKVINVSSGRPLTESYGVGASNINKVLISIQGKSLVIASSGNVPKPAKESLLAGYKATLLVGASTINPESNREDIAKFTTRGKNLDVLAPGVNIPTYIPGIGKTLVDGTSFSAPFVAKLAAILLAINPQLSSTQIKNLIILSCDKILTSEGFIYNRVNFLRTIIKAIEFSSHSY